MISQFRRTHAAPTEILSTKLTPPRPRAALVARAPLLARLDEGLDRKLTLLSAPAGFGKTTLVSQWLTKLSIEHEELRSAADHDNAQFSILNAQFNLAWVALDAGDNDPVRFWRYVITACQAFDPAAGAAALGLLHVSQQRGFEQPPFEAALTTLINELARLPGRCVLVLEDYHVITARQVHEAVAFLLDHLPAALHLVIMTRSDPPLPLARLRAHDDLAELRAADLRFSPDETAAFLGQALQLPLAPDTIARLADRTEGWVAGLRLLALALQGRERSGEIAQALETFTGSHRHIAEYLAADVLGAQPEPLQQFLLQTAFLGRLSGPLCDAVTGRDDSDRVLEHLERANLFLLPLDGARQWYRYHALFAEAMQHEARRRLGEAALRALYLNASRWYEQHGLLADAVEAALGAQDFPRAAALIAGGMEPQRFPNEVYTLRRWLEHLPAEVLHAHPALCFNYAMVILFTADRRAPATMALLQEPLRLAEQRWRAEGNQAKLGEVLALRSIAVMWQGDLVESFAAAGEALTLLPEQEVQWRGTSLLQVGMQELLAGRAGAARQWLIEAHACCEAAENMHGMLACTLLLGDVCVRQGELHQAAQQYRQLLAQAEQVESGEPLDDRGWALAGLSALAYEWNDLEAAERQAAEAREVGALYADAWLSMRGALVHALARRARGEHAQAQQQLQALAAQLHQRRWPHLLPEVRAYQAWLALAAGDLAAAERWRAARVRHGEDLAFARQLHEREVLVEARLLIAQDRPAPALALLEHWRADARAEDRGGAELEIMVLMALAHAAGDDLPTARRLLIEALALAQPEGYRRLFLDEGPPMARLLRAVAPEVRAEPLASYVQALLHTFASDQQTRGGEEERGRRGAMGAPALPLSPSPPLSLSQELVEPLSPQEQRVLRLLAAGLSNPEIAGELVVSVNTIKTQLQSIYRKLNVTSRAEARRAARQLDLL